MTGFDARAEMRAAAEMARQAKTNAELGHALKLFERAHAVSVRQEAEKMDALVSRIKSDLRSLAWHGAAAVAFIAFTVIANVWWW